MCGCEPDRCMGGAWFRDTNVALACENDFSKVVAQSQTARYPGRGSTKSITQFVARHSPCAPVSVEFA